MPEDKKTADVKGGQLSAPAELTIEHAVAFRDSLQEALGQSDHVVVRMADVQEADAAGLQLLCSAHRFACQQGKTLRLESPLPEKVHEALKMTGLQGHLHCEFSEQGVCIWKKENA